MYQTIGKVVFVRFPTAGVIPSFESLSGVHHESSSICFGPGSQQPDPDRHRSGQIWAGGEADRPARERQGKARYRVDPPSKRSLSVEVEKLKPLAGQTLTVFVISGANTVTLGTIRISALGAGKIERKTELGHSVPSIVQGDIVQVRNGDTVVQSGTF